MMVFVIFLASVLVLFKSSEQVIVLSSKISGLFGLSKFAIGFLLISVSTSMPEIFVAILSSIQGEGALSVGNVLGSNITNLTLVLGVSALAGTVFIRREDTIELIEFIFVSSLISVFVFHEAGLSFVHGLVLLSIFSVFASKLFVSEKKEMKKRGNRYLTLAMFFLWIFVLLVATRYLVESALHMAELFGLPNSIIGATIIALGTSLPELSTGLQAVRKKEFALAMSMIIGSCATNITLVLGITTIFSPVAVSYIAMMGILPFVFLSTLTVWYMISKKGYITRNHGLVLIGIYILFLMSQFGVMGIV